MKSSSARCPIHHWTQITSYLSASGVNSLKKKEKGKQWVSNSLKVNQDTNQNHGNLSNSNMWKQSASTSQINTLDLPLKHPNYKHVTDTMNCNKLMFQFKFQIYMHIHFVCVRALHIYFPWKMFQSIYILFRMKSFEAKKKWYNQRLIWWASEIRS